MAQNNPEEMTADELRAEIERLKPQIQELSDEWDRKDAANYQPQQLDPISNSIERLSRRQGECEKRLGEIEGTSAS